MVKKRKFAEGGSPDMEMADDLANESFSAAFKRNREGGNKTFEWRGKKYTTDVAKPKAKGSYSEDYAKAKEASDKRKAQKSADVAAAKTKADAYSAQLARESAARSNPYGYASMYKKGGKVKKYAEGGNVNYSENETTRMRTATPDNLKRLQDRARRMGASEASIDRATRGVVPKFARGGGIESRGKTRGTTVKMARGGGIESRGKTKGRFV
jgi:hypothetical protein